MRRSDWRQKGQLIEQVVADRSGEGVRIQNELRGAPANEGVRQVLFIDDLARVLGCSRSTIERRRRSGTFPIPELPALDSRPRWSREAVDTFLASTSSGFSTRRGRPRRRVVS